MRRSARAYLQGFGAVQRLLESHALTLRDLAEALDPDRDDARLSPGSKPSRGALS